MVRTGTETCNSAIINIQLCPDAYLFKLVTFAFLQINYNSHMTQKNHFTFSEKVFLKNKNPWNQLSWKWKFQSQRI